MKKKTVVTILAVLLVLFAVWVFNAFGPQNASSQTTAQTQQNGSLTLSGGEETGQPAETAQPEQTAQQALPAIDEQGAYTSKEDVSLYLYTYGRLPENFITKSEARALGWNGGGLDDFDYGKCIGGDRFGNNEGMLPESGGRTYYECDIDTLHQDDRGPKRIVYSDDGLVYYTDDHYESFTLLYGEP